MGIESAPPLGRRDCAGSSGR